MNVLKGIQQILGKDWTAYLMNLTGQLCWFVANIIATEDRRINVHNVGLSRGIVTLAVAFVIARVYGDRIDFKKDLSVLNVRNFIVFGFSACMSGAFYFLELPIVYTCFNGLPIFVYILDYFYHNTTVSSKQLCGLVFCCIGMVFTINSRIILLWLGIEDDTSSQFQYLNTSLVAKLVASVVFLLVVAIYSYSIILTRRLQESNAVQTNLHLGIVLIMSNALGLYILPSPKSLGFVEQLSVVAVIGALTTMGTWFITLSLFLSTKYGNINVVSFLVVPISYVVSMFRYGQNPNALGMLGSVGIGMGLYFVLSK